MIRLFSTAYITSNNKRTAEMRLCLERNLALSAIDEVCLLVEGNPALPDTDPKLKTRPIDQRPLLDDYVSWAREIHREGDITLIANADIYFEESIALASQELSENQAWALARWDDCANGDTKLFYRNDSQDAWAFASIPENLETNFPLGVPRCDNRLLFEMQACGLTVFNPGLSIKCHHLHDGVARDYSVANDSGFVPEPYRYLWPHNLWPLGKTLNHNRANPAAKVGWQLDQDKLNRSLPGRAINFIRRGCQRSGKSTDNTES
ncbi:MAG: hypothetical protein AAFX93_05365 [Verrucomicrobiota bacterium]